MIELIQNWEDLQIREEIRKKAQKKSLEIFGNKIYIRGLIEFTNYCKNSCYYCGINKSNTAVNRYRLSAEDILQCCRQGHKLGFRTFVLQGGEDMCFSDDRICDIIYKIKSTFSDCAVTLSIGEKSCSSYKKYFDAGADRYLLRHETADEQHYSMLHPKSMSLKNRKQCLYELKAIGYQVGCGFMVGSPYQTMQNIADDLAFIKELEPHMVGIGPFIPHKATRFANFPAGSAELTLYLISILRLMLPYANLPATTALNSLDAHGREKGVLSGANVIMPNLSPPNAKKNYLLYNNKAFSGEESAYHLNQLKESLKSIAYEIAVDRGDYKK